LRALSTCFPTIWEWTRVGGVCWFTNITIDIKTAIKKNTKKIPLLLCSFLESLYPFWCFKSRWLHDEAHEKWSHEMKCHLNFLHYVFAKHHIKQYPENFVMKIVSSKHKLGSLSMQRFWATDGHRKCSVFLFYSSSHYHIYIFKSLCASRYD